VPQVAASSARRTGSAVPTAATWCSAEAVIGSGVRRSTRAGRHSQGGGGGGGGGGLRPSASGAARAGPRKRSPLPPGMSAGSEECSSAARTSSCHMPEPGSRLPKAPHSTSQRSARVIPT
jgi:hypothetical protein